MTNLKPIFVREEVKRIVELNKKNAKTSELGASLENLLEGSERYLKLKKALKLIEDLDKKEEPEECLEENPEEENGETTKD